MEMVERFGQIAESEWRVPLVFEMREADEKVILHANGQVRSMANDFEAVADELETRIAANAEKIKDGEVQRKRAEKRSFQQQEIDLQLAIPKLKDAGVDTTDKERRVLEIQNTIREIEAEIERLE